MLEAEQARIKREIQRKQRELLDAGFNKARLYWYVLSDGSVHYAFNEKEGAFLACITENGNTLYDLTHEVARRRTYKKHAL